jgi:nitrite reductase (NADH) small subunit
MEFVDVGASEEFAEGRLHLVQVGAHRLATVRIDGRVYAVDNRCPHRDGELVAGDLEGFHLFCPLHAWVFDVRDGRAFFPKGAEIACFPVRESRGRVLIGNRGVKPSATGQWP